MSAKFTAGPWNILEGATYPGIDSVEKTIVIFGDDGEEAGVRGDTKEERVANARLMAASTELLEATQTALAALDAIANEMTVGDRFTNAGQMLLDALEPCRAAIAKATGETK